VTVKDTAFWGTTSVVVVLTVAGDVTGVPVASCVCMTLPYCIATLFASTFIPPKLLGEDLLFLAEGVYAIVIPYK
jgi:hypothetical protein